LAGGYEVEKRGGGETAKTPHEHWEFAIMVVEDAQFLRQGVVDGLHFIEAQEVKG
jgi:hypothetical protein